MTQRALDKVKLLFQRERHHLPPVLGSIFCGGCRKEVKEKINVKTAILPNVLRKAKSKLTSLWYC